MTGLSLTELELPEELSGGPGPSPRVLALLQSSSGLSKYGDVDKFLPLGGDEISLISTKPSQIS